MLPVDHCGYLPSLIFSIVSSRTECLYSQYQPNFLSAHRVKTMSKTTVAAIIIAQEDGTNILLALRNHEPFKGKWCLPGGHIDLYESVQEAVVREVKEEVGLDFGGHFFGYFDEIIPDYYIHAVVMVFVGSAEGALVLNPGEVTEARWYTLNEARALSLAFKHNEILDAYAARISIQPIPDQRASRFLRSQ
jgi:8-oxo-dGTP diphosphatase